MTPQTATKPKQARRGRPPGSRRKVELTQIPRVRLIPAPRVTNSAQHGSSKWSNSEYEQLCFDLLQGDTRSGDSQKRPVPLKPESRLVPANPALLDRARPSRGKYNRDGGYFNRQRSASNELPDPKTWCSQFTCAYIEVLNGRRGVQQIERWLTERITRQVRAEATPPVGKRAADSPKLSIRSLHVSEPIDSVIEGSCVVHTGSKFRAMTFRFEGWDGKWMCTHLRIHN